ncbi:DUF2207 domain-containing protein [Enteractinococcus helveticum]|uniref:DUF2207 domain-containing protein n=1 Tax=Enteractinococcus helveticum TaxID=1837282 RepID=UPI0009EE4ADD|nr:DUF2207 domain-containing protein [Enteractinococcus helveticum]
MSAISAGKKCWAACIGLLILTLSLASTATAQEQNVEDFEYAAWNLTYDVGLDADGRAVAEVTEELHAEFPEVDQNRGIIRSLPLRYQSAPAAPENISVTDGSGAAVPFEVDNGDGFRSILIGDDDFVHGSQTYVISYTLHDVMHTTQQADEFYWDIIPSDRPQHIDEVTAQITLDAQLTAALTGSAACYVGTPEQSQACDIQRSAGEEAVFGIEEAPLPGGHGVTVAIGVEPGTVVQTPQRQENFLLDVVPLLIVIAATLIAGGGALAVMAMVRRHRHDTSQASIEYGIPRQVNPLLAGQLVGKNHDPIVATILDLAVRGVLRIEETQQTSRWSKQPETKPMLRLIDPQLVDDPQEDLLLRGMFPNLQPGETFDFPKNSKPFMQATQAVVKDSTTTAIDRGYQHKQRHAGATVAGWTAMGLLIPAVVLLMLGASRDNTAMTVTSIMLGVLCLMLSTVCVIKHRVLTPRGAALRRQLEGLEQVMRADDAARLNMMQSFTNAPHRDDDGPYVHVYDRLLPYAVQFGLQKQWTKAMANTYTHNNWPAPMWYPRLFSGGHRGAETALSSMLSSVSSAASTSSPTAGSTGGGAVGGGGGGGAAGGR